MTEHILSFTRPDGANIFYRFRPAANGETKNALILLHRGHEHSQRMMHLADELALGDFAYFAWDARGHGQSSGERGDAPSIAALIADLNAFVKHIQNEHGFAPENIGIIAQSVGAVLLSGWLNDYAPNIRCAILAAPAFHVKLYVPFARPALRLAYKVRGNFFVNSYVKAHYLTHDSQRQDSYNADPLIAKQISVRILLGLHDLSQRLIAQAHAITTPMQILLSGSDFVVSQSAQQRFYNHLGSHIKERHVFDGFYHDLLGEQNREPVVQAMRDFIEKRFAENVQVVDVTKNHLASPSRVQADKLATPLCRYSPRGIYWATQRALLKLGAEYSYGLQTGMMTGFDSGSTLDYVYKNQARGINSFGDFIDGIYLNAVGWRGIRQRKIHVEQAIALACEKLKNANKKINVLDIAAGQGRYVLDAFSGSLKADNIRLRDFSDINVQAGKRNINERGFHEIATFECADAFDRENYKKLKPRPTLGIVSGLHELFSDNDLVLQSLKGLGEAIAKGGYLIYTNQPHHPQLAYIARCLTSHKAGSPNWVMRLRSQQEMDQLVELAGFRKLEQWIDDDGIFTVSLAVKGEEIQKNQTMNQNENTEQFIDGRENPVNW